MFPKEIYTKRREELIRRVNKGIILLLGNSESAMNYRSNPYRFRQDSTFLYYFGLDKPDLAAILDAYENKIFVYGDEAGIEDIIWMGKQEKLTETCSKSGVEIVKKSELLIKDITKYQSQKKEIHFLPPYRENNRLFLSKVLGIGYEGVNSKASLKLIDSVVSQRSVKDEYELTEMESAMSNVTAIAYQKALENIKPGKFEHEISGLIEGTALQNNCTMAYTVICSVNGQTLHNHYYGNRMKEGQLLLIDAGAESPLHYANDITRTYPVSGIFSGLQKTIYNIVLKAETESIKTIKEGKTYRDIHLSAAAIITEGLKELGLMKGKTDDIVNSGAHALFFPHGLGHMIGLDVHDMEDLGENFVGYDQAIKRSDQFGLAYLRLAKKLKKGFVLTVEPGIYFIPELIQKWKAEGLHKDFIEYGKLEDYLHFGGIRIEDNVIVYDDGCKIIGRPIPKSVEEIEMIMKD